MPAPDWLGSVLQLLEQLVLSLLKKQHEMRGVGCDTEPTLAHQSLCLATRLAEATKEALNLHSALCCDGKCEKKCS